MDPELRAFFTLTPCIWSRGDGPAGIVMSDWSFCRL
ncbi:hypothetical protein ACLB1R_22935 [Escherichia coli]